MVPRTNNLIEFSIEGPGEIVATDNGDPTNMVPFSSDKREAFGGLMPGNCPLKGRLSRKYYGDGKIARTQGYRSEY